MRPPGYHYELEECEAQIVSTMRGVLAIVRDGSFLAVVAQHEEQAIAAAARLAKLAQWRRMRMLDERPLREQLLHHERASLRVVDGIPQTGDPGDAPTPDAALTLQADYQRPYIMHGSIGPSAAAARFDNATLHVHSHSQIYPLRDALAKVLAMASDKVRVTHVSGPGCYGHNGADDVALDAALVARAVPGRSVLLEWERADEHGWEPYGSAMLMRLRASLDHDNRDRLIHHVYSDTHTSRPAAPTTSLCCWPARISPNRGNPLAHSPTCVSMSARTATRIRCMRSAGNTSSRIWYTICRCACRRYARWGLCQRLRDRVFIHELAEACGEDAVALRLRHLQDARGREVLERAADAGGWWRGTSCRDRARIGFARYANSKACAAVVVDVTVSDYGEIELQRAVIAADAGRIVDADGLGMQLEGGFLQAASWTLKEQVRYDADGITSRDWDSYPILRFDEVPTVETVLIDRPDEPSLGAGEATPGLAAGAIANAVCDAIGLRLREMPFTPERCAAPRRVRHGYKRRVPTRTG